MILVPLSPTLLLLVVAGILALLGELFSVGIYFLLAMTMTLAFLIAGGTDNSLFRLVCIIFALMMIVRAVSTKEKV